MSFIYPPDTTVQLLHNHILTLLPSGNMTFNIFNGHMPSSVGGFTDGQILAVITASGTTDGAGKYVTFSGVANANAAVTGRATWCEVLLGPWAFICPVRAPYIELSTYDLVAGQPVSVTWMRFKAL